MKKTTHVRGISLLLALLLVFIMAGCAGASSSSAATPPASSAANTSTAGTPAADANPFEGETLTELKVAAGDWVYVAQERGLFEETFGKYGITITPVEGTIGQEAQLMARGDLHVAGRMLYPYLLYRTQGADMIAIQNSVHPHEKITTILVPKDSPVQTFADLRGKKIASWRAGCPYMVLFELADNEGWVEGVDWEYVNIPASEHKDGLLSGEIDAISSHLLGDIIPLVLSGEFREIAYCKEDGIYVNGGGSTVIFTPTNIAAENPKILQAYLALMEETQAWILANQDEAAPIVESINRTPVEISKFAWQSDRGASTWHSEKDFDKIKSETAVMQEWLVSHGDLEKGVDVDSLYDPQYFT